MKYYEILFVLPGTLSEDEVTPEVDKVKKALETSGASDISIEDKGKSRLAYPMKHIRYGYFQLGSFQAEPSVLPKINAELKLLSGLLRTVIRKVDSPEAAKIDNITAISDVTVRDRGGRSRDTEGKESASAESSGAVKETETAEAAARKMDAPKKDEAKEEKKETKEEKSSKAEGVKMEDIDKKLDELLETDIADV